MESSTPDPWSGEGLRPRKRGHLQPVDSYLTGSWDALGAGAPVLVALAQIASQAMVDNDPLNLDQLSIEARAILFSAKSRGVIEIKGVPAAFDPADRWIAVYVQVDEDRTLAFRSREQPEVTIRFLEGFRQLCQGGLVVHHLHHDFSLSHRGFQLARQQDESSVREALQWGVEESFG